MICRYCGSNIDKYDDTCPNCGCVVFEEGAMLDKKEKLVNDASYTHELRSNSGLSNMPTLKTVKANPKLPVIPIILLCVLLLGVSYMRKNKISLIPKKSDKKEIVEFAGYNITLLKGYEAKLDNSELLLSNGINDYKVVIDFDHPYKDYYSNFSTNYPDLAKDCKMKINKKEYCGISTSNKVMAFFTEADSNKTFVGSLDNKRDDFSSSDLINLNSMLESIELKKEDRSFDSGGEDFISLHNLK